MDTPATTNRSWRRPHVTTVVVACIAGLILAFLNVPGNRADLLHRVNRSQTAKPARDHGWPLVYLHREYIPSAPAVVDIWSLTRSVTDFYPWRLAANGAVVLGIGIAIGALVESLMRTFRPQFRFGLRSGMIGICACCVALAWAQNRWRAECEQRRIVGKFSGPGGYVKYSEKLPDWIPALLGRRGYTPCVDHVEQVSLNYRKLSEQDCRDLSTLHNLRSLSLSSVSITDGSLMSIGQLHHLSSLWIEDVPISDDCLKNWKNLDQLEEISLSGTRVTDAGLENLVNLPRLKSVYVERTAVTQAGAESFTARSPSHAVVMQ